jgi:hypothetical protein
VDLCLVGFGDASYFQVGMSIDESRHDRPPGSVKYRYAVGLRAHLIAVSDQDHAATSNEGSLGLRLPWLHRDDPGIDDGQVATAPRWIGLGGRRWVLSCYCRQRSWLAGDGADGCAELDEVTPFHFPSLAQRQHDHWHGTRGGPPCRSFKHGSPGCSTVHPCNHRRI